MLRRRATTYETWDFPSFCDLALAFRLSTPSAVQQAADNLDRIVLPLHLRHEAGDLVSMPSPAPRHALPSHISDLSQGIDWLNNHHPVRPDSRLANLAFNDSQVVLNVSHGFSDGGYLKCLTEHLFDRDLPSLPRLPPRIEDLIPAEYSAASKAGIPWTFDPDLSQFTFEKGDLGPGSQLIQFHKMTFPASELPAFDKRAGKLKDTTDYLWVSLLLASAAVTGRLPPHAGISNCDDLRRRVVKPDLSVLKCYGHLYSRTDLRPQMSLREVASGLRADMWKRYDALEDMGRIKFGENAPPGPPIPGVVLEVSNVGPFRIKAPIVDLEVALRVHAELPGKSLATMAYSVVGERKNELRLVLRYRDSKISHGKIIEIAGLVRHVMTKVSLDRTVQSVFEELRHLALGSPSPGGL